jgi:hypothetical protein
MQRCVTAQVMEKKAAAVQARSDRNRRDPLPDTGDSPDEEQSSEQASEQSSEQSSEPSAGSRSSADLRIDAATDADATAASTNSNSSSSSSSTSSSASSKGRGNRNKKQASVSLLEDDDAELDADATVYSDDVSDDVSSASDSPELQLVELAEDSVTPAQRTILKEMTTSIYAMEVESHPVQVGDAPEPFLRVNIRGQAFLYNQVPQCVHHSCVVLCSVCASDVLDQQYPSFTMLLSHVCLCKTCKLCVSNALASQCLLSCSRCALYNSSMTMHATQAHYLQLLLTLSSSLNAFAADSLNGRSSNSRGQRCSAIRLGTSWTNSTICTAISTSTS